MGASCQSSVGKRAALAPFFVFSLLSVLLNASGTAGEAHTAQMVIAPTTSSNDFAQPIASAVEEVSINSLAGQRDQYILQSKNNALRRGGGDAAAISQFEERKGNFAQLRAARPSYSSPMLPGSNDHFHSLRKRVTEQHRQQQAVNKLPKLLEALRRARGEAKSARELADAAENKLKEAERNAEDTTADGQQSAEAEEITASADGQQSTEAEEITASEDDAQEKLLLDLEKYRST